MQTNVLMSPETIGTKKLAILAEIVELKKFLKELRGIGDINSYLGEKDSILNEIELKTAELKKIELEVEEVKPKKRKYKKKTKKAPQPPFKLATESLVLTTRKQKYQRVLTKINI